MTARSVKLTPDLQRKLSNLARPSASVEADEVLVLVIGEQGALVSRTKVPGHPPNLRDLKLRLAGAEAAVTGLAISPVAEQAVQLTTTEAAVLKDAGLVVQDTSEPGAMERSRIDFEVLVRDSLTLEQAAKALRVSTGRLRQRLGGRRPTLYGFKDGRSWRVPRFQIGKDRKLVRGLDQVIPHIRRDAHPLAVVTWFSTPHQDLVAGGQELSVTPLAWLSAGSPPQVVARLAEEI